MKRKNTYKELHIDDLMLLIPDDLYTSDWKHSHTKILWSHKKVEYKIFGKMDANIVIDIYLAGNPHLNKRRQIISLHDINLYSEKLQEYLINTRYAKVLAIGYKYLSELQEVEFAERYVSSVAWNNQTSDELSYTGFEDFTKHQRASENLSIQFSSYTKDTVDNLEKTLCSLLKCSLRSEKLIFEFKEEVSYKSLFPAPFFENEQILKNKYTKYLFFKDKVYLALNSVNSEIYLEIGFAEYVYHITEIKSYNKIHIGLQTGVHKLFKHHIKKDYVLNFGNDLYSERTQIINLLHGDVHGNTPWVILQKKYSDLKKIIFNITYENRQECVYFYGYDKDWNIIWKRKRILKTDRDSIITNKKQILKNLI